MSHLDEEVLASLALGETADDSAHHHLRECDQCAASVAEYEHMLVRVGSLSRGTVLRPAPARVWDSIQAEVAEDVVVDEVSARRESKRSGVAPWLVGVAAAAGVVIGGVGVGTVIGSGDDSGQLVASAALTDLATETDAGSARVEVLADGTEVLVLDTDVTSVEGAALEVWLIDPNVEGMISLGHLTEQTTTFVIPAGFNVADFPIVDVSVEPFDGDPTHSGDSITRGVLDA